MAIYLDYNATAPLRPEAIEKMQEILSVPSNPSSVHSFGRAAKKHLEDARKIIADSISAFTDEVIFTSSGTEANATALCGFPDRRVLVSAIEHSSVLKTCPDAPRIPVTIDGVVDVNALEKMLAENSKPALVSVMLANNETGVIQPIADIAAICKKYHALLHCDAVQALGKIPVDFGALGADILSLGAHKCGCPVGAAAMVIRRNLPFKPLLRGGKQEENRRASTSNVAAMAAFAVAIQKFDLDHMKKLRGWLDAMEAEIASPQGGEADRLGHSPWNVLSRSGEGIEYSEQETLSRISKDLPSSKSKKSTLPPSGGGVIFGKNAPRLPNTSAIAMPGVASETQIIDFDLNGFAVSAGSACTSGRTEISQVLAAMNAPVDIASCFVRVSGGWNAKEADIKAFSQAWKKTSARLCKRAVSA